MSTGSSTQASTHPAGAPDQPADGSDEAVPRDSAGPARLSWMPRLQDARIRSKLTVILFVPLVAVLALATVRLIDVGQHAVDAATVEDLTRLGTDVSDLTQALHQERMAAAGYLADPSAKPGGVAPAKGKEKQPGYTDIIAVTDAKIDKFTTDRRELDDPPAVVAGSLSRIDDHLRLMDATRKKISDRDQIAVSEAVLRYGVVITDLINYHEVLGQYAGEGTVANSLRALSAFARAKAGTAEQEAVSYAARASGDDSKEQLSVIAASQTSQQEALEGFSLVATTAQQQLIDDTVSGDAVNLADQTATRVARGEAVPKEEVLTSLSAVVDLMRWAEQRIENETLVQAADESDRVGGQAAYEAGLVLLVLIVAVALAVLLARSLNNSLRRLREGALAVANRDLPDAVARLRDVRNLGDGGADDIVRQMRDPIRLSNRDEIGQVAQAFNVVHREAVRIAAEQAALRTSVSAMFLNLARRSQSLVDRMIGELDTIERNEEDPKRLARLFELDHLATRMRRNDENLLVLAGADSSAPRREDALVVDALRAAQSEVELYNRVEFGTVDTDISITAAAVNDVVRLVAELLDNATRFSPPNTVVVADGRRIRDYVVIQVEDRGLGMSEEQMDSLNQRLAETPDVDVAAFRLMGLAVVSRLANRYGIRVELRANIEGGTVAQVILPNSIVILPNSRPLDQPSRGARQLDAAPTSWNDPTAFGRTGTATATLPATGQDSWQSRAEGLAARAGNGGLAAPLSPAGPGHPQLQAQPSQLPGSGEGFPTPGRPALPRRGMDDRALPARTTPPAEPASAMTGAFEVSPATTGAFEVSPATTGAFEVSPATTGAFEIPPAGSPAVAGSPTMAFPIMGSPSPDAPAARSASPDAPAARSASPDASAAWSASPDASAARPASPGGFAPEAGRPAPADTVGWGAELAAMPSAAPLDDRAEASPIFLQMQQSWFRGQDGSASEEWSMPTAGYAPPPSQPALEAAPEAGNAPADTTQVLRLPEAEPAAVSAPPAAVPPAPASTAPLSALRSPSALVSADPVAAAPVPAASVSAVPASVAPVSDMPAAPVSDVPVATAPDATSPEFASVAAPGAPVAPTSVSPAPEPSADSASGRSANAVQNGSRPADAGSDSGGQPVPRQRKSAEDVWRTAADEGWQRAMAAAQPNVTDTTRSGLPKRTPQAQLVPGGVQNIPHNQNRRSPDQVRGLLSAYHRGVQRGRTAGSEETASIAPAPKEN